MICTHDVYVEGNRFASLARLLLSADCACPIHPQRRRLQFKKSPKKSQNSLSLSDQFKNIKLWNSKKYNFWKQIFFQKITMKTGTLRRRALRRIAHTRGVKIEHLEKLTDAQILTEFWRHLRVSDIAHFSDDSIEKCEEIIKRINQRKVRNQRYVEMKQLESNGYFELSKGKIRMRTMGPRFGPRKSVSNRTFCKKSNFL
mgnify:CR=1 FL=1